MKALALTILTILTCLFVANLLTGNYSTSSQVPAIAPANAAANAAAEVAVALPTRDAALPVVTVVAPANAVANAEASGGISDGQSGDRPSKAPSFDKRKAQNVPVSAVALAEPVAVDVAPMQVAAEAVADAVIVVDEAIAGEIAGPAEDAPASAAAPAAVVSDIPQLDAFVARVANGQIGQVVGVFIQDEFALPVLQQPDGQANYVSLENHTITQFASAGVYGTIGLLAHNYLSGQLFFGLDHNQNVYIVYGDGLVETYRIDKIERYQALDPTNPYSYFIDTADPSQTAITAGALFNRVYAHSNQVVLQTCIEANGNSSWGRLFITATRVQ